MMKDRGIASHPLAGLTQLAVVALALGASAGCNLAPGPPPAIRWYSAAPEPTRGDEPAARQGDVRIPLRLRRVTAARHLGERVAWRQGVEYGFDDLVRWTELPDAVVGRALERALFESGAFLRDGRAELALDVEVRAFEEIRSAEEGASHARVELALALSGVGDRALLDRSVAAEVRMDGEGGAALAEATRLAVGEATATALALVTAAASAR